MIEEYSKKKSPSITFKFVKENEVPETLDQVEQLDNYMVEVAAGLHQIPVLE